MATLHRGWILIVVALIASACGTAPPLTDDEIPGDFIFSYEMTVTDQELYEAAMEEENAAEAPAKKPTEEGAADGETPPAAEEDDTEGREPSFIYVEITDPGNVKFELRYGEPNPATKEGTLTLTEAGFKRIYELVRKANLFEMKHRYVGTVQTGKKETFYVRGGLRFKTIDVDGVVVPKLEALFQGVRAVLINKEERLFFYPREAGDIYVVDKRNMEFHRGDCPKLNEVSDEFRIRANTSQECLNLGGSPCETCNPLQRRQQ